MQSDKWYWVPWVVGIFGGGAAGALITSYVTYRRNKQQPIAYKIDTIDIFRQNPEVPSLHASIKLDRDPNEPVDEDAIITFDEAIVVNNLSVARILLHNSGNQDIQQFQVGITLKGSDEAIDVKTSTRDRHHVVKILTPVSLKNPQKTLDFSLEPFNRDDPYRIDIYFTYIDEPQSIELSTSHPIKLVEISSTTELARDVAYRVLKEVIRRSIPGF